MTTHQIWLPELCPWGRNDGNFCADYFAGFMPKIRSVLILYGKSEALSILYILFYGLGLSVIPSVLISGSKH